MKKTGYVLHFSLSHYPVRFWTYSLSAAVEVRPLAGLNESGPVEWVAPGLAPQHLQLHLPQSLAAPLSSLERFVIRDYYIFRRFVGARPETYELALRSGEDQRASQALHSLAVPDLSQTRVACGERHQLGPPQIQSRHLERGQQAVIISASASIGSRQRQSGTQQRVFDPRGPLAESQIGGFLREGLRICG